MQVLKIIIPWITIYYIMVKQNITIDSLYEDLESQLNQIEVGHTDSLSKAYSAMNLVQHYLERLKEYIIKNKFQSQEEEIRFFKETKPRFYCWLIYFSKVYQIHLKWPAGGDESVRAYLQKQLGNLKQYFDNRTKIGLFVDVHYIYSFTLRER